jgi:hypothetical protein
LAAARADRTRDGSSLNIASKVEPQAFNTAWISSSKRTGKPDAMVNV